MIEHDPSFLERVERLSALCFARCVVYTMFSSGLIYLLAEIVGQDIRGIAVGAGWTFNVMVCYEMGYIPDQRPERTAACLAVAFLIAAVAYLVATQITVMVSVHLR